MAKKKQFSGNFVIYLALVTAATSQLVVYQPFPAPFGLFWRDIHLVLGVALLVAAPIHFIARRKICAANARMGKQMVESKKD